MTDDLVAWLRAQLDDDEQVALACEHRSWTRDGASIVGGHSTDEVVDWVYDEGGWEHIARHDPARVLAEVAAKRRIIDWAQQMQDWASENNLWSYDETAILKLLALPYADRPGYRDEWAPDTAA